MTTTTLLEQRRDFAFYASLDPRIGELLAEAQAIKPAPGQRYCASVAFFGPDGFRTRLGRIVGYGRLDGLQELRSARAYSTVFQRLYHALPPCTHDGDVCGR